MKYYVSTLLLLGFIAVESSLAAADATSTNVDEPPDVTITPGGTGECQAQFDCPQLLSYYYAQQKGSEVTQVASYCNGLLAGATPPGARKSMLLF